MAVPRQYAVTVGTSAVVLDGTQHKGWMLCNNSANTIYLGDENVTTSTGFPILAGAYFTPGEIAHDQLSANVYEIRLWAIAAGAGNDVRVFLPGRVV